MSARKFTDSDLPQLKKDYKELKIYRLVGDKYDCNPETVRLMLKPETRKKYNDVRMRDPIKLAERTKRGTAKWRDSHPERYLLIHAKYRAKKKHLAFNLEEKDIVIPRLCPVLGIPLGRVGGKRTDASPSLDRIEPKQGYVKGNVLVISWVANRIKGTQTNPKTFEAIAAYLRRNLQEKK